MHSFPPRRRLLRSTFLGCVAALLAIGCDAPTPPGPATVDPSSRLLGCGTGLLEGAASEVPGLESFLSATSVVQDTAGTVAQDVRDQLEAIAQGLGLQTSSDTSLSELAMAVEAAMLGSWEGQVQGLEVVHGEALCLADADLASAAAADCDPAFDAASALTECLGTCVGVPGASLSCDGDAQLRCTEPAPEASCDGQCMGSCAEAVVDQACDGTCMGSCDGICTVLAADGSCEGSCIGACSGMCGSLGSGSACDGTCMGDCITTPQEPDCSETEVPSCEPGLTGLVECNDLCQGAIEVSGIVEACTAPVAALANAATECVAPPSQAFVSASASADDSEQAQAQVWADGVSASMSTMLASQAQAQSVLDSALSPTTGLLTVVEDLIATVISTLGLVDATCVVKELEDATATLEHAQATLQDAVQAVGILDTVLSSAG